MNAYLCLILSVLDAVYLLLILACTKGSYGQDCKLTCNDKCDGCNKVDGSCDEGCQPGWQGDNCQQRYMFKLYYNLIFLLNQS